MSAYREDAHEDRSLLLVAANSSVTAFRRADGRLAWKQEFPVTVFGMQVNAMGAMEMAFHGGRVYVAQADRIVCLDYTTGAVIGQIALPKSARKPCFLLEGDHLYVVGATDVICLTHSGQVVWQTPHGQNLLHGPALGIPGNVRQGDEIGTS